MHTLGIDISQRLEKEYLRAHMTISFSYAYLNGLDRLIVSSPCVHIAVQRPNLAISPRMTENVKKLLNSVKDGHTIHQNSLSYIICVMTGYDVIDVQHSSSPIKGLPPEYTAEGAVVLSANL